MEQWNDGRSPGNEFFGFAILSIHTLLKLFEAVPHLA
jgi:hypothetical protein